MIVENTEKNFRGLLFLLHPIHSTIISDWNSQAVFTH